jgi:Amt family ammonium transporter
LGVQALGVAAGFLWSFTVSVGIFLAIKYTIGLRVSAAEEVEGLDITEHGMHAYPPAIVHASPTPSSAEAGAFAPSLAARPATASM